MRRRRFIALTLSITGGAGCTGETYRASGPRTLPPAPPTEQSATPALDTVDSRAQAVIRPLNEAYRVFRDPLVKLDVADVPPAELSTAEQAVGAAREAVTKFSTVVTGPPATYRSLPTLVTAHERLVDALAGAVDLAASLSQLGTERVDNPTERLGPLRSQTMRLGTLGTELRELAAANPAIPPALFLSVEGMRSFATTLDRQSAAVDRLLDASLAALDGAVDWRTGVAAFDRREFSSAESAFTAARTQYQTASNTLTDAAETEGSFADVAARRSCSVGAALEALLMALEAVALGRNGDVARATERLRTAQTTRNRCETR